MSERKNIKLPADLFDRLKADKNSGDVGMSWPRYFEETCLSDDDAGDLAERLDSIEAGVQEAAKAAQSAEASVEELQR